MPPHDLIARLARAMDLVREYRGWLAISRVQKALQNAVQVLSAVRETSKADQLRTAALSLDVEHRERGDRWALARELEALRSDGIPSHRVARALFDIGCCIGERRTKAIQRCEAWARSERRRWRDTVKRLPRQSSEPAFRSAERALSSSMGIQPEEASMGKVVKRTTTVTEEILDKDETEDLDEDAEDADESEESESEEEEKENHGTVRRRKRR